VDTLSRPPREGGRSWCQRETLLCCFRLRYRAQALRRKMFYCLRRTFSWHECFFLFQPVSLALKPAESTTFLSHIMKCHVDICVNSCITVMLPGGTTMLQEIGESMTKKPSSQWNPRHFIRASRSATLISARICTPCRVLRLHDHVPRDC